MIDSFNMLIYRKMTTILIWNKENDKVKEKDDYEIGI